MPSFEDIRSRYPGARDLTDEEIIERTAEITKLPLSVVADDFGYTPRTRNPAAFANDTVISTANAALGGAQAIGDFFSPGNSFSNRLGELVKEGESKQSLPVRLESEKLSQALSTDNFGEQVSGVKDYVLRNPIQAAAQAVGSFAIPGGAIKGFQVGAKALDLGAKAVTRAGTTGAVTAGAVLGGGDAAGDAYDMVYNSPKLEGLSPEERDQIATAAARKAQVVPTLIGGASGLFGADKALAAGGTRSILKTAGAEFLSEAVEEGTTKLSANLAAGEVDSDIKPLTGVAGSALLGGILGGGTGLAIGAMTKQRPANSLLSGATNTNNSVDDTAINQAIDGNSQPAPVGPIPRSAAYGPNIPEQAGPPAPSPQRQAADAAQLQVQQDQQLQLDAAAKQEQQRAARSEVFRKYGGVESTIPGGTKPLWNYLGKNYFTLESLGKAVDAQVEKEAQKSPLVREVETALTKTYDAVGLKPYTPGKMTSFLTPFTEQAESLEEVAGRIEAEILNSKENTPQSDTLKALRNVLLGKPVDAAFGDATPVAANTTPAAAVKTEPVQQLVQTNTPAAQQPSQWTDVTQQYLAEQAAQQQGEVDGQQQLQTPPRLGDVSVQGRTDQGSQGVTGDVRPSQVRSERSGSDPVLTDTEQDEQLGTEGTQSIADGSGQRDADVRSEREEARAQVRKIFTELFGSQRDADIMMELQDDYDVQSQTTIAKKYGVNQSTVSRVLKLLQSDTLVPRFYLAAKKLGMSRDDVVTLMAIIEDTGLDQDVNSDVVDDSESLLTNQADDALANTNTDDVNPAFSDDEVSKLGNEEVFGDEDSGATKGGFQIVDTAAGTKSADTSSANKTQTKYNKTGSNWKKYDDFELQNLIADDIASDEDLPGIIEEVKRREAVRATANAPAKKETKAAPKKKAEPKAKVGTKVEVKAEPAAPAKDRVIKPGPEVTAATPAIQNPTQKEKAAFAWDRGVKDFPQAPKFAELTADQQRTWISFGDANWTKEDVKTELAKLAKDARFMKDREAGVENNLDEEQQGILDSLDFSTPLEVEGKSYPSAFITLAEMLKFDGFAAAVSDLRLSGVLNTLKSVKGIVIFKDLDAHGVMTTTTDPDTGMEMTIVGISEALLKNNDARSVSHTLNHELGHAVDDPVFGGVYSSQPEFNVRVNKGKIFEQGYMGSVMRELYALYKNDPLFKFLSYPFEDADSLKNSNVVRGEVFAQMYSAMANPATREMIKDRAPVTHAFMEDVLNDVKTTAFQDGTKAGREAETIRRANEFENNRGQANSGARDLQGRDQKEEVRPKVNFAFGGQKTPQPDLVRNANKLDLVVNGQVIQSFEAIPRKLWDAFAGREAQAGLWKQADKDVVEQASDALDIAFAEWQEAQPLNRIEEAYIKNKGTFNRLVKKVVDGTATKEEIGDYNEAEGYLTRFQLDAVRPSLRKATTFFSKSTSLPQVRQETQARIDRMPKAYRGTVQTMFDFLTARNLGDEVLAAFAFTRDVTARAAKAGLKAAQTYQRLYDARKQILGSYSSRIETIIEDFNKLDPVLKGTGEKSVNRFIKDSTVQGKWGFQPNWLTKQVTVDPEMQERFEALEKASPKAAEVIKAVFKYNYDTNQAMKKSIMESVTSEFDALIAQAKKDGDIVEEARLTKEKAKDLSEFASRLAIRNEKPYAALKRFGSWVIVGKSKAYMDAEDANDQAEIRKLQTDENHYVVQFAETNSEAQAIYRELDGKFEYLTEPFKSAEAEKDVYGGSDMNGLFYRLRNLVEKDGLDDPVQRGMVRMLNSLHLKLLSEESVRQSENQRKNISGADDDMMRAFVSQGRAAAHFVSSLTNSAGIYDAMREMRKERDARTPGKDVRSIYYNEIMKRHGMELNYDPTPITDLALNVTSTWMLLTSPGYFFQNATQPFLLSLPYMGSNPKFGYTRTANELLKTYGEVKKVVGLGKKGLTEGDYKDLPADVRGAIEELVNRGSINISLSAELGRFRSEVGVDEDVAQKGAALYTKGTDMLRGFAENLESINRLTTAMTAYRMALKSGMSNEASIDYADKVIYNTHGDYSGANAPRIMRSAAGRVATQFRKFQLIQISLMARLWHDWRKGATPEERIVAKRQLMFTLGHTFAVGGIMGMPGFTALAFLWGALFGDEDEPDNPELTLRRLIGNDDLADLLVKGVPAFMGVDLSGKLGMGQMLSILPYTDFKLTRDSLNQAALALIGGPFLGGLAPKAVDGAAYMAAGEYYKGLEMLMPKGIGDAMKGFRIANEGVTNKRGDVMLSPDEISFMDSFLAGLGLPTTTLTERQFAEGAKFKFDEFYNSKTTEIKNAYAKAYRAGDAQGMAEARQKWMDIQQSRAKNGYSRQPLSALLKAPMEQRKREMNSAGGVGFDRGNRRFVQELTRD